MKLHYWRTVLKGVSVHSIGSVGKLHDDARTGRTVHLLSRGPLVVSVQITRGETEDVSQG